eukprot:6610300-Pyramimonas_sp.AAC.1
MEFKLSERHQTAVSAATPAARDKPGETKEKRGSARQALGTPARQRTAAAKGCRREGKEVHARHTA